MKINTDTLNDVLSYHNQKGYSTRFGMDMLGLPLSSMEFMAGNKYNSALEALRDLLLMDAQEQGLTLEQFVESLKG